MMAKFVTQLADVITHRTRSIVLTLMAQSYAKIERFLA
jgi:hypothetical protein